MCANVDLSAHERSHKAPALCTLAKDEAHIPVDVQLLLGHTDGGVRVLQQAQFAFLAVERPAQVGRRIVNPFLLLRYRFRQGGASVLRERATD